MIGMAEKSIDNLKTKKDDNRAKSQIMKDLQEVSSILEKLEKITTDSVKSEESSSTIKTEKESSANETVEDSEFFDYFSDENTNLSDPLLDKIIDQVEDLVITQLKDSILRLIENMVSDQLKITFKVMLDQKKELPELLKFYKTIKMIGFVEITGFDSALLLPFLINKF